MDEPPSGLDPGSVVVALLWALGARASGLWQVRASSLVAEAFATAPDLSPEAALAFEEATRTVPLDRSHLGIVRAATTGEPAVSIAADLAAEEGSGYWLRAFGASRSVAVPLFRPEGSVWGVLAVAVGDSTLSDASIAAIVRSYGLKIRAAV